MHIYVLFILRKESYEGECAPEAIAVSDEFCEEEGFDTDEFMNEELVKFQKRGEKLQGGAVVKIAVDTAEIRKRCVNEHEPIKGEIVKEEP